MDEWKMYGPIEKKRVIFLAIAKVSELGGGGWNQKRCIVRWSTRCELKDCSKT